VACSSGRWWLACDDEVGEEEKERVEIRQCDRKKDARCLKRRRALSFLRGGLPFGLPSPLLLT